MVAAIRHFPRALVALAAIATVSACQGDTPLVDRLANGRVHGDAERVSVQGGRWDALPLAVAHCSRFGRSAQFDRLEGDRSLYRCIPKPS